MAIDINIDTDGRGTITLDDGTDITAHVLAVSISAQAESKPHVSLVLKPTGGLNITLSDPTYATQLGSADQAELTFVAPAD